MQFSCLIYVLQINSVSTLNTVKRIQVCPNWTCSFCVSSVNDTVYLSCCSLFPIMYLLFKHSPGRPTLQESLLTARIFKIQPEIKEKVSLVTYIFNF